jgi:hypothetical protein
VRVLRVAIGLLAVGAALLLPQTAWSKGNEPFQVVSGSGAHWVRGADLRAWWHDFLQPQAGSCGACVSGPVGEARWTAKLERRWGNERPEPVLLLRPHELPMLFYPATSKTPAYVYTPEALGKPDPKLVNLPSGAPMISTWGEWQVATARMQSIVERASRGSRSSSAMWWGLGGGLGAVLALGGVGMWWHSRRLSGGIEQQRLASPSP